MAGAPQHKMAAAPQHKMAAAPQHKMAAAPQLKMAAAPQLKLAAAPQHEMAAAPQHEMAAAPQHEMAVAPQHETAVAPQHETAAAPQHETAAAPQHEMAAAPQHEMAAAPQHEMAAAPQHEMAAAPQHEMAAAPLDVMAAAPLDVMAAAPPLKEDPHGPVFRPMSPSATSPALERALREDLGAKLYNTELLASTYGAVTDHLNGTYTVRLALLWHGTAQVSIRLVHSSEAVQVLCRHREQEPDKVYFLGYYEEGVKQETAICNAQRSSKLVEDGTTHCCCEYREPVTGEIWFCRRPSSLPCHALTYHSMGGYQAVLSQLEKTLLKR
ncbi:hypothetical protein DPEC_G00091150 [Dallia pectoralis]|uniref:Uncharacterized protein n=1 Tax=Dallia pectoralis TaxID=75939 RepID=A0ACC2H298_DALPE|nr:hypothetical protein DPEC_G00091150 [Dallia pectoralis]